MIVQEALFIGGEWVPSTGTDSFTVVSPITEEVVGTAQEIFGPVGIVIAYDDDADAVRIANDSTYGLAGAVFTEGSERGIALAKQVRTGLVAVNSLGMTHAFPFGGYKDSGVGRSHGPEGFAEFFEIKTIGLPPGHGV